MVLATGLQDELHAGLAHVQRHRFAHVLDADHVRSGVGHERQQPGQAPRAVGDARVAAQPSPGAGLVSLRDERQQAGIDVAPGEHDHGRAVAGRRGRAGEQGGDADGARALDDQLRAFQQPHHGLGDVVFIDDVHLVDPALHERQRQGAGPLDGDPVGDRRIHLGRWPASPSR